MEIKKILLAGFMGFISVGCAIAQNSNAYNLQSGTTEMYVEDDNDAEIDEITDNEEDSFSRNAGLEIRSEKEAKRLDKQYEKSGRQHAKMIRAEERKARKLERAH